MEIVKYIRDMQVPEVRINYHKKTIQIRHRIPVDTFTEIYNDNIEWIKKLKEASVGDVFNMGRDRTLSEYRAIKSKLDLHWVRFFAFRGLVYVEIVRSL